MINVLKRLWDVALGAFGCSHGHLSRFIFKDELGTYRRCLDCGARIFSKGWGA
jgi:hypothetical protein